MPTALAGMARVIKDLKCVEPEPPKPPETIKDPTLTKRDRIAPSTPL